jgi:hypothetical protein
MPQGPAPELIGLMRQVYGEATVMDVGVDAPAGAASDTFAWTAISPGVLRVRRAGSVCGPTFDAKVVARLLDEPLGRVLERRQVRFVRGTSYSYIAECLEMSRVKGSPT